MIPGCKNKECDNFKGRMTPVDDSTDIFECKVCGVRVETCQRTYASTAAKAETLGTEAAIRRGRWKCIKQLYHFTDRANLQLISKHGGLWSLAALEKRDVCVPKPGGNDWSHVADHVKGLDSFVHLCFTDKHPMEYVAKEEGRIIDPVYLSINPTVMQTDGVRVTLDVSNKKDQPILTPDEAIDYFDFEVLCKRMDWHDPEIQARWQAVRKYEFLVPNHVPMKYIRIPNG